MRPVSLIITLISVVAVSGRRSEKSVLFLVAQPPKIPLPVSATPFVTFYGDELFRGKYYHHYLKGECTNLPSQYDNWASSVDTYDRCVYLCDAKDCGGQCKRVHGQTVDRLTPFRLNDKVSSVKFCYTFAQRG